MLRGIVLDYEAKYGSRSNDVRRFANHILSGGHLQGKPKKYQCQYLPEIHSIINKAGNEELTDAIFYFLPTGSE